ncbi:MAG: copper homeostasis protein CutC [Candidatus Nanopelagicales bacterium]|nr:copper homeostasis protein CutC [Candidatus Nanopelagicales bacterium]
MNRRLEICCYSVDDAVVAQEAGADRIELCAGRPEGGTTPSIGSLALARERVRIPVFPMVRARGGDFCYRPIEFETMCRDVTTVARMGFPGVVFGVLRPNRELDTVRTDVLIAAVRKENPAIEVTFHRAFDQVVEPERVFRELGELGCARVLTSGQKTTAVDGIDLIYQLLRSRGEGDPTLLPGGGVRPSNVSRLLDLGLTEVHSTATPSPTEPMDPVLVRDLARIVHGG